MKPPTQKNPARYVWVCEIHGAGKPKKIVYDAIDLITEGRLRRITEGTSRDEVIIPEKAA